MKTKLILIIAVFSFIYGYSQTIIEIHPGDNVNQIFDDALMNVQPSGIVFNFFPGTYYVSEINVATDGQAKTETPRIIIKSNTNNASDVTINSSENSVFHISASFTTLQNLSITSLASTNNMAAIWLEEDLMSMALDSVIIENCIINADTSDFDNGIIYQGSTSMISNIHIQNNLFNKGGTGINLHFSDNAPNITITNNTFRNQVVNNIDLSNIYNLKLLNNNIELPTTGASINNTATGILLSNIHADYNYTDSLTLISGNRIFTNTTQTCLYTAMRIFSCNSGYNAKSIISNNFIDIENNDSLVIGIISDDCVEISLYNNTVKLSGLNSEGVRFITFGDKAGTDFIFKNNIIISDNIVFNSVYTLDNIYNDLNNNCYFSPNISSAFMAEQTPYDFTHWKNTFALDTNSIFENPQLIGFNDPTPHNPMLSNLAPTLPEVNIDINGIVRNLPNCDFGAKEVAFVNLGNDTSICFDASIVLDAGIAQNYIWNTGATSQSITTDSAGQYIVTITEISGGATATDTINVMILPELSITFNSAEPNCYTSADGYIVSNIVNGTTPIDYNWAGSFDGDGTDSLFNLGIGSYYLTVTDANLCTAENYSFINAPTQLSLSFDTIEFCGGCIGELTANAAGGTGSYNYSWSNGSTNYHIMDLCTGTYILTLTDDNNCSFIDSMSITEGPLGYLAGTIDYSGGLFDANDVKVELYKQYIENAFHVEKVDENMIDGTSKFEFTGVYPYQYTFRGIVEQGNYQNVVTSYYGNTVDWYNATYVTIGCGDTINDIEFSMYEVDNLNGTGTFSGNVTYESSNKSTNLAGEPVTGAEIYIAQDPNTEPMASAVSDNNGYWEVDSIQEGTGYRLRVDIPGLEQISTYENLYITPNDTVQQNLNFIVDTTSGGGIMADTTFSSIKTNNQTIEIKVYPNPSTDFVSFETSLKSAANIKFEIININGETLYTSEELNNYIGDFRIKVDISDYSIGTYLLKFKIDNNYYLKKIIKQ